MVAEVVFVGLSHENDLILEQVSIANTCNSLYAMIQQRQRDIEYREAANDARQRFALAQALCCVFVNI